jgi:hypothetical protein
MKIQQRDIMQTVHGNYFTQATAFNNIIGVDVKHSSLLRDTWQENWACVLRSVNHKNI